MSEPFLGEIRMFAGTFAPRGWAFCDGQLLAIAQNDALFSLLGTLYGGDGRTSFGLPDLRGRLPIHAGQGPGLSNRRQGQRGGAEAVTLTPNQLPPHSHPIQASAATATGPNPEGKVPAEISTDRSYRNVADTSLSSNALTAAGGSQSHPNLMPFLCVHFIIALIGIFPSRN